MATEARASRGVATLTVLATLALLIPWLELMTSFWLGGSGQAAASLIAVAGALLFSWHAWRGGSSPPLRPGLVPALLVPIVLAYLVSILSDLRIGVGLCPVLLLAGLLYLYRGGTGLRAFAIPLLLLALAAPLPGFVLSEATLELTELATTLGHSALAVLFDSVEREGFLLRIPGGTVAVVEDCSGLRGLLLFVPLGVIFLTLYRPVSAWKATLVVFMTVPLALAANLLRILLVAALLDSGPSPALHEVLGIFPLGLAMVGVFLLSRWSRAREAPAA